jgi:hypothetical protein
LVTLISCQLNFEGKAAMKPFIQSIRKLALPLLLVAFTASGCVIATGGPDSKPASRASAGAVGADHCQQSSDGKMVACGGKASYCQQSADGHAVACGGQASYCEKSSDGTAVACGGQAQYCERSADGRQVACGGGR